MGDDMAEQRDGRTTDPLGERLADVLGWASLGLGVPQLVAPGRFARAIGIRDTDETRFWTRVVGVRELGAAAGILELEKPRPVGWVWGRVLGDVKDLTLLVRAWQTNRQDAGRLAGAIAAVLGIGALDLITALRLSGAPDPSHLSTTSAPAQEGGPMRVKESITVRRPRSEVYAFWRDLRNLPEFMYHLREVTTSGPTRSHWVANAPIGSVEWDAEIFRDVPGEMIAWRSVEGSKVSNAGIVHFTAAPGDRGTEIHVDLSYSAPGGPIAVALAKLMGEEPRQQVKDDLRRFKQVMEVGEVVRSEGSPEGQTARRHVKQRPAQPLEEPVRQAVGAGRQA
jgi:uncharacterized membrane protein